MTDSPSSSSRHDVSLVKTPPSPSRSSSQAAYQRRPSHAMSSSPPPSTIHPDHPLASMSFMLESSLIQFQFEIRDHVSALVFGYITVTDFLSYEPFLSYATLECLLSFSVHRMNEIVTFILKMRDQPLALARPDDMASVSDAPVNLTFAEPAKQILLLRTMLILASYNHTTTTALISSEENAAIALQRPITDTIKALLCPSRNGVLSLSANLCDHLELSALHFFVSPLPASPPMTKWSAFVHVVTGGSKKIEKRKRKVKGNRDALDDVNLTKEQKQARQRLEEAEEDKRQRLLRRKAENGSESKLASHDRLTLLYEELQQLWAAILGALSVRCDRATSIVSLFLPHLACSLPRSTAQAMFSDFNSRLENNATASSALNSPCIHSPLSILSMTQSLPSLSPVPLPHSSHSLDTLTALIRGLSLLQLTIETSGNLNLSHALISTLFQLLSHSATANATRRELGLTLASLLSPLALEHWSPKLSYRQWFSLIATLYMDSVKWIEHNNKPKNHVIASSLLVATLCCCDPETFIRHFSATITALLTAYHQHRKSKDTICKEASAIAIASLKRLLQIYLAQRSSRHESTLTNLEHIHQSFLLSPSSSSTFVSSLLSSSTDEENFAWMTGSTQAGLIALILTAAKADANFAAHEIVLPMIESQERRRQETEESRIRKGKVSAVSASEREGVSGQVVTGLRALTLILCIDDEGDRVTTGNSSSDEPSKHPSPAIAQHCSPQSLYVTLANLRQSLASPLLPLSFFNAHAHGRPIHYLNRLTHVLGTILAQCNDIIGYFLLIDRTESSATTALDERYSNTLAAMRYVLKIITIIWPTAQPFGTVLTTLVRAALHLDAGIRSGSRKLLLSMMKAERKLISNPTSSEDDKSNSVVTSAEYKAPERGAVVMSIIHQLNHLPNFLASSSDHHVLLTDLLGFVADLLRMWLQGCKGGSDAWEGLTVHHVEAAVGVWLAAVHPGVRIAAVAVLLVLRALANHIEGRWRLDESNRLVGLGLDKASFTVSDFVPSSKEVNKKVEQIANTFSILASSSCSTPRFLVDFFISCKCSTAKIFQSLTFDSLLHNHECISCGKEDIHQRKSHLIFSITEQLHRDEAKERREKKMQESAEHGINIHFRNEEEMEDGVSTLSQSSMTHLYPDVAEDSVEEFTGSLDSGDNEPSQARVQDVNANSPAKITPTSPRNDDDTNEPIITVLLHSSEWKWSALLAHWLRACSASAIVSDGSQEHVLSPTLDLLFTLIEQRLVALSNIHSGMLAKRGRGLKAALLDCDEKSLESHGLSPLTLAMLKNLSVMGVIVLRYKHAMAPSHSFLTTMLVPLIHSPYAVIRRLAALSMGNCHLSLAVPILTLLAPIENSFVTTGRTQQKDDQIRGHIAHIYRLMAETYTPTDVTHQPCNTKTFVQRIMQWIKETYIFLGIASNEFRWDLIDLRRHFCVAIEKMALATSELPPDQKIFDHYTRHALFDLLHAWCGHGPASISYRVKVESHKSSLLQRLRTALTDEAKVIQLAQSFQNEIKEFRLCALSAMAALIKSPCDDDGQAKEIFAWLKEVLTSNESEVRDIAYLALECFIQHNETRMNTLIDHCYHENTLLARRYFLVLGQLILLQCQGKDQASVDHSPNTIAPGATQVEPGNIPFGISLTIILHLCIFKLGDASYNVRAVALKLLPVLEIRCARAMSGQPAVSSVIIGSHLADTYRQVQYSLSARLSSAFGKVSDSFLQETFTRFNQVKANESKAQMLTYAAPWLTNIRLTLRDQSCKSLPNLDKYLGSEHSLINGEEWEAKSTEEKQSVIQHEASASESVLDSRTIRPWCFPSVSDQLVLIDKLIELTANHNHYASRALEVMWINLAHIRENVSIILVAILGIMQQQQGSRALEDRLATYKRIALYCSRANPRVAVWKLVQYILQGDDAFAKGQPDVQHKSLTLTMSQFSLLLLVEVAYEIDFNPYECSMTSTRKQAARSSSMLAHDKEVNTTSKCRATTDMLAVLLHIGALGLSHCSAFIRHYSSVLLINIVHATAFKAYHSADTDATENTLKKYTSSFPAPPPTVSMVSSSPKYKPHTIGMFSKTLPMKASAQSRTLDNTTLKLVTASAYSTLTGSFPAQNRLSSAPSAGLSLVIADSQKTRVLGIRQRRALLLMSQLNDSTFGRSDINEDAKVSRRRMSHEDADLQDNMPNVSAALETRFSSIKSNNSTQELNKEQKYNGGGLQFKNLNLLISTLLRIVPESGIRNTLSQRWAHHAVCWATCSPNVTDSITSYRIYRALQPPLIVSHYWRVVNALEWFVQRWRAQRQKESLPARPSVLNKQQKGNLYNNNEPRVSLSLYEALRTLQDMVSRLGLDIPSERLSQSTRRTSSTHAACLPPDHSQLRCEMLPCLFWACLLVLQQSFVPDIPISTSLQLSDQQMLITCIDLVAVLLSSVSEEKAFEEAVYNFRSSLLIGQDTKMFVGILPLMIRGLLSTSISPYAESFPCLNMLGGTRSNQQLVGAGVVPCETLSAATSQAIFNFIAQFNPLPSSPLCGLLDISSFAQRMLPALLLQLPWICSALDRMTLLRNEQETKRRAQQKHDLQYQVLVNGGEPQVQIPCLHSYAHGQPEWLKGHPALDKASSQWSSLFSQLGLTDLAIVFACTSHGHFEHSNAFLQDLSMQLMAVLPASTIYHSCMLLLDAMEKRGAFACTDAIFHSASEPKAPRYYAQLVGQKMSEKINDDSLAYLNTEEASIAPTNDNADAHEFNQHCLAVIATLFSTCNWKECGISLPSSQPLFQRLHMLLHSSLAPLVSKVISIALRRAEDNRSQDADIIPPHSLAMCIITPAIPEAMRYQPNPRVSRSDALIHTTSGASFHPTSRSDSSLYPAVNPELAMDSFNTPSRHIVQEIRNSGLLSKKAPTRPTAPTSSEATTSDSEDVKLNETYSPSTARSSSTLRKVHFKVSPTALPPRRVSLSNKQKNNIHGQNAHEARALIENNSSSDEDQAIENQLQQGGIPSAIRLAAYTLDQEEKGDSNKYRELADRVHDIPRRLLVETTHSNIRQPHTWTNQSGKDNSVRIDLSIDVPLQAAKPLHESENKKQTDDAPDAPAVAGSIRSKLKSKFAPLNHIKPSQKVSQFSSPTLSPTRSPTRSPTSAKTSKDEPFVPKMMSKPTKKPAVPIQAKKTGSKTPAASSQISPVATLCETPPPRSNRHKVPIDMEENPSIAKFSYPASQHNDYAAPPPSNSAVSASPAPPRPPNRVNNVIPFNVDFSDSPSTVLSVPAISQAHSPAMNNRNEDSYIPPTQGIDSSMDIGQILAAKQQREAERDKLHNQHTNIRAKLRELGVRRPESLVHLSPPSNSNLVNAGQSQVSSGVIIPSFFGESDNAAEANSNVVQVHGMSSTLQMCLEGADRFAARESVHLDQLLSNTQW